MAAGAVTFGGGATDAASVGVIAAETQLATATYLALVKPSAFTANRVIYQKAGNIRVLRYASTAGDLQLAFQRATTATSYITNSQPLLTLNQYYLVAVTVDTGQAQVVHIKTAPYTAGAFGALTEATYGTATAGVGTINADNGSASVWGNNAGGSAVWQGDMAAGAVFASVLSDADILSWANKPRQVVNGTAAVQMRLFGMGGADAIDYAGNAAAAMTGGVQANGPGILTPVDDARTLVAAAGSNTVLFSVHDARMNFLPSAWTDAINAINGRAAGLSLAQAVAGSQPAISAGAERINFSGTKSMATGQDVRLNYDVGSSLFVFAIGKFTSGPVVAIAADPTTKASFPYSAIQVSGGNLKSVVKSNTAGTEFNPDSGTAQDTTMRAVWMGKRVMTATESWLVGAMGRTFDERANATAATAVAGGSKTAVGAFNGANGTFELVYLCYHLGEVLPAFLTAFYALAVSLGASSDNSCTGRVCFIGDSNYQGTQTSNGLTALDGSGTTSQLALAANATTGPRPLTFASRGIDASEPHKYIRGYGGQGMGNLSGSTGNDWERDVALGSIGLVNGRYVIVTGLMYGGAVVQHWTLAQWKTNMAAIYAQSKTLTVPTWFVLHTGQDGGGSGTSTFGFYNAASPSTVLSTPDGQGMVDFLAELRAHPTLYCDQLIDTALNLSVAQIQRAVSLACDDTTYYAADRIHMKDAMAQITGPYIRTQLDLSNAFNDPLWPPSAGLSRMGFKLSLGF